MREPGERLLQRLPLVGPQKYGHRQSGVSDRHALTRVLDGIDERLDLVLGFRQRQGSHTLIMG